MAIISGSLLRTTGVPIPTEIASGSEFTVTLVEGPGYMTIESKRDNNGFYTGSANFSSVSSSNMVSTVFGEFIIGSYTGYTTSSNLTFIANKTIPANQLYVKIASPIDNPRFEIGGLVDDLLTVLEERSSFFENEVATRAILTNLESIDL